MSSQIKQRSQFCPISRLPLANSRWPKSPRTLGTRFGFVMSRLASRFALPLFLRLNRLEKSLKLWYTLVTWTVTKTFVLSDINNLHASLIVFGTWQDIYNRMESISEIDNSKTSNVTLFICLFIKQGHKRKSKALKTFWFRFRQGRQAHEAWFRLVASETQLYMKKSAFDNILKVKGNYHKCPCGVSTIFGNNIVKIS